MPPEIPDQTSRTPSVSADAERLVSNRPEPPRLGVSHLMVLTICVAAYAGLNRSQAIPYRMESFSPEAGPVAVGVGTFASIGGGAAAAGLLLLMRRRRGLPFPKHPGEYLLVLTGVGSVLDLVRRVAFLPFVGAPNAWVYDLSALAMFGIYALAFLWALASVPSRPWQLFFLAIPGSRGAAVAVGYLLSFWYRPGAVWRMESVVPNVLVAAALIAVVLSDHLRRKCYPWTHWFGVATRLWLEAAAMAGFLWIAYR